MCEAIIVCQKFLLCGNEKLCAVLYFHFSLFPILFSLFFTRRSPSSAFAFPFHRYSPFIFSGKRPFSLLVIFFKRISGAATSSNKISSADDFFSVLHQRIVCPVRYFHRINNQRIVFIFICTVHYFLSMNIHFEIRTSKTM